MKNVIDEKTTIPIVMALGLLPVFAGFVFWLSSVDAKATKGAEASEMIPEMRTDIREIKTDVKHLLKEKGN